MYFVLKNIILGLSSGAKKLKWKGLMSLYKNYKI